MTVRCRSIMTVLALAGITYCQWHCCEAQTITPVLQLGSDSPEIIRALQRRLNIVLTLDPPLAEDGQFGARTRTAIVAFQQQAKLAHDGIAGAKTWAKLYNIHVQPQVRTSARVLVLLRQLLDRAGLETATITSGHRTADEQARIMYENLAEFGVASQNSLYGPAGDRVIEVFVENMRRPRAETILAMAKKIEQIGPARVSRHCDPRLDVIDVAPSSIGDRNKFEETLTWAKRQELILRFYTPPQDPAYHIEMATP